MLVFRLAPDKRHTLDKGAEPSLEVNVRSLPLRAVSDSDSSRKL